ncbi:MAG TPA: hypothetical protein VJS44_18605 [Pyrinomonadaceae bacterium]|nr:hypothetical protein [Pyrinomonadaceae bacterium]
MKKIVQSRGASTGMLFALFALSIRVIAPGTKRPLVQRFRRYAIEVCSDLKVSHVVGPTEYE